MMQKFKASKNKRFFELSVLDSVMWTTMASYIFIAVFLKNNGLSTSTIGILISTGAVFSIITQPLWGSLCDGVLGTKKTMIATAFLGGVSTLALAAVKNISVIMVIYVIRTISMAPMMMLFDNYVVSECKISKTRMDYGAIRIWGSIFYAAAAAVLGWATEKLGINIAFYFQAVLSFLLIWLIIKYVNDNPPIVNTKEKHKRKWFDKNIFSLSFVFILIYIFFVMLADNSLNSFFPLIFQDAGGSLNMLGISSSIRAIVEVPFFLSTARLIKRFGSKKVMLVAVSFTALRVLGFIICTQPTQLLLVNLFGAPAYCLFTAGMLHYVYEISPENSKTTAQLIVSSLGLSLSHVVSSSAGGFILENYGVKIMSIIGLGIIVVALVIIMIQNIIVKSKAAGDLNSIFSHFSNCFESFFMAESLSYKHNML